MQFKNPEILYFLFALLIPVLVHLLQLRRFVPYYFTNLKFLKQLEIQSRKSSKIKKRLLLCTRLLLLFCVVIAFADPFFPSKSENDKSNELYLILDNSYSMQAKGKSGELLKRSIQDLLENIPKDKIFTLVTNTDTYWNTTTSAIQNDLQKLSFSANSFDLEEIFTRIKSNSTPNNKDFIIISDAIGLNDDTFKSTHFIGKPFLIIPKAESAFNISIDSVYLDKISQQFQEINVVLSSYGKSNTTPITISLYNKDKVVAKSFVIFRKKIETIKLNIPKSNFTGYLAIEDNSLNYDNTLYFTINNNPKLKILSIGEESKSTFLNRIYTNTEFDYSNVPLENLNYANLSKQNTIILNELNSIPQTLQTTLTEFVTKGGNLVIIPSEKSNLSDYNAMIKAFGRFEFLEHIQETQSITKINFNNPIYKNVFENKVRNFQYPNTKTSLKTVTTYPPILSFNERANFATLIPKKQGNVVLFSAAINTNNSNFQQSPLIVPLFYNAAKLNEENNVINLSINPQTKFTTPLVAQKNDRLEISNGKESFIPSQALFENKVQLQFGDNPKFAGNYQLTNNDNLVTLLSFNYKRTESDLTQTNQLTSKFFKIENSLSSVLKSLETARTDQKIWKWFVIFALLFLILETIIIKFKR